MLDLCTDDRCNAEEEEEDDKTFNETFAVFAEVFNLAEAGSGLDTNNNDDEEDEYD